MSSAAAEMASPAEMPSSSATMAAVLCPGNWSPNQDKQASNSNENLAQNGTKDDARHDITSLQPLRLKPRGSRETYCGPVKYCFRHSLQHEVGRKTTVYQPLGSALSKRLDEKADVECHCKYSGDKGEIDESTQASLLVIKMTSSSLLAKLCLRYGSVLRHVRGQHETNQPQEAEERRRV
jgi:hypothetical protein